MERWGLSRHRPEGKRVTALKRRGARALPPVASAGLTLLQPPPACRGAGHPRAPRGCCQEVLRNVAVAHSRCSEAVGFLLPPGFLRAAAEETDAASAHPVLVSKYLLQGGAGLPVFVSENHRARRLQFLPQD